MFSGFSEDFFMFLLLDSTSKKKQSQSLPPPADRGAAIRISEGSFLHISHPILKADNANNNIPIKFTTRKIALKSFS